MKRSHKTKSNTKAGRPRGFDAEATIDAAMRVFWEKGYEGATLADLTDAMGINRPSLYAAFGDKEALFRLAIARYAEGPLAFFREALEQPTAQEVIETLLHRTVEFLAMPGNPRGCLSIQGALACGNDAEPIKKTMIEWRKQVVVALQKRFQKARREKDFPDSIDSASFARYISVLLTGLSIQAANGATKSELKKTADLALRFVSVAVSGVGK